MTDHPAPTSAAIATVLALLVLGVLGWTVGQPWPTLVAMAAGGSLAGAGLLGARDGIGSLVGSSLLFVVAVGWLVLAVVLTGLATLGGIETATTTPELVAEGWQSTAFVLAVCVAAVGASTIPRGDAMSAALESLVVTAVVTCGVLLAAAVPVIAGTDAVSTLALGDRLAAVGAAVIAPASTTPAPGTALVLAGVAGLAIAGVATGLPIAAFAERGRRDAVRDRVRTVSRRLRAASIGAVLAGSVVAVLPDTVWVRVRESLPAAAYDSLVAVTTAATLRGSLVAIAVGGFVVVVGIAVVRRLRREYLRGPARLGARGVGGVVAVLALRSVGPAGLLGRVERSLPSAVMPVFDVVVSAVGPAPIAFGSVLVACLSVAFSLYGLWLFGVLRIVPPERASPIVAALGLGAATVAAGLLVGPSVVSFLAIAAAIVVWDAGAYGQRLRRELGAAPTRRAELVHASGTLAVGLGGAVVVFAGTSLLQRTATDVTGTAGLLALLGALLLAAALRG